MATRVAGGLGCGGRREGWGWDGRRGLSVGGLYSDGARRRAGGTPPWASAPVNGGQAGSRRGHPHRFNDGKAGRRRRGHPRRLMTGRQTGGDVGIRAVLPGGRRGHPHRFDPATGEGIRASGGRRLRPAGDQAAAAGDQAAGAIGGTCGRVGATDRGHVCMRGTSLGACGREDRNGFFFDAGGIERVGRVYVCVYVFF